MLEAASQPPSNSIIELPSLFLAKYGVIRLLEPANCDREKLLAQVQSSNYNKPFIIDDGNSRSLYFSLAYVQSAMRVDNPYALEFAYTRKMMSFLLFQHQPRSILILGLGGGSLAKYCHRHLSSADITVVEIDPNILAFREQFLIPPDDSHFRVRLGDAAEYIRDCRKASDVIMMDAFDRHGFAASVCSSNFYANVIVLPVQDDGNYVVFAFRDSSFEPRWRWINSQANAMRTRYGLDFPKFAGKLERSRKMGYLQRIMHQPELF